MKNKNNSANKTIHEAPVPPLFKKWWVAIRPFSLPASTMSVIFGTTLAVTIGKASFHPGLFIAAFIGMALLHAGSNLLNDVFDYQKGIDRQVNPVSGAVVRGWITPATALRAGLIFIAAGTLLGLFVVSRVGMPIFWIGAIGGTVGILYTWGPLPLKFNGMGDLAVFLNFGILGSLGAWTVQTGYLSWIPVIWSVPMSLLVVAILHANNWRDINSDSDSGIRTMASMLGDTSSETYYTFLLLAPFVCILWLILLSRVDGLHPEMPFSFLITLFVMPGAVKLIKKGRHRSNPENPQDFIALDGDTAKLNLLFGILCTLALGLNALICP
jgi:1,4-dihydroxy-2-naphthoate octaprenyltransferase